MEGLDAGEEEERKDPIEDDDERKEANEATDAEDERRLRLLGRPILYANSPAYPSSLGTVIARSGTANRLPWGERPASPSRMAPTAPSRSGVVRTRAGRSWSRASSISLAGAAGLRGAALAWVATQRKTVAERGPSSSR